MSFSLFTDLVDQVESTGLLENSLKGKAGFDGVLHTAGFAAMGRAAMLLNEPNPPNNLQSRVGSVLGDGAAHLEDSGQPTEVAAYMRSVSDALVDTGDFQQAAKAGVNPSVSATQEVVKDLQLKTAVANEQRALQRGETTSGPGEGANDVDFKAEGSQTQGYIDGALDQHNTTIKTTLTTTIPTLGAMVKSVKTLNIADSALDARASFVDDRVKDLTNALASTTIKKVSGVQLERVFEGYIHAAKFSLFKAGSSLALEAPSVRVSGQLLALQANIALTEADDIGFVGQWMNQQLKHSWTLGTENIAAVANTKLLMTAGTARYYGQQGTIIGDKKKVTAGVDSAGGLTIDENGNVVVVNKKKLGIKLSESGAIQIAAAKEAQLELTDQGKIVLQAKDMATTKAKTVEVIGNDKVIIRVGGSAIVVSSSKIDLNPSSAPQVSSPEQASVADVPTLDIVFAASPKPSETPQREATSLPAKGKRNPIPAPLPYKPNA